MLQAGEGKVRQAQYSGEAAVDRARETMAAQLRPHQAEANSLQVCVFALGRARWHPLSCAVLIAEG